MRGCGGAPADRHFGTLKPSSAGALLSPPLDKVGGVDLAANPWACMADGPAAPTVVNGSTQRLWEEGSGALEYAAHPHPTRASMEATNAEVCKQRLWGTATGPRGGMGA